MDASKRIRAEKPLEAIWSFMHWLWDVLRDLLWLLGLVPLVLDYIATYVSVGYRPVPLATILDEGLSIGWVLTLTVVGLIASAYRVHLRSRGYLQASLSEFEAENRSLSLQLDRDEQAARAEILVALRHWWWSIQDYEMSYGEMGSASEAGELPLTPDMGIQLQYYMDVRTRKWMYLKPETQTMVERTERVFLAFITCVYGVAYNHELLGDQVPKQIMRNEIVAEYMSGNLQHPACTYQDCRRSFAETEAHLSRKET